LEAVGVMGGDVEGVGEAVNMVGGRGRPLE